MRVSVYCITDSRNYGDFLQTFLTAKLIKEALNANVIIRGRALMMYAAKTILESDIDFKKPPRLVIFLEKEQLSVVAGHTTGYGNYDASIRVYSKALKVAESSIIFPCSISRIRIHRTNDKLWRIMKSFDRVFVRGFRSYTLLESFGLDNIDVALDTGFALRKVYPDVKARKNGEKLRVAIVPRKDFFYAYGWIELYVNYLKTLKATVKLLKKKFDAEITFAPFSFGYDTSDVSAVEDLIKIGKFEEKILWMSSHTVKAGYERLSEFDLVITSRMHAGIMAMSAGVPAIIVLPRNEQKSLEVLDYLELEEYLHFADMFFPKKLPEKAEHLVDNISEVKKTVDKAVRVKVDDVMKPVKSLKELLDYVGS